MSLTFKLETQLPGTPEEIYKAWLNSEEHAAMTGGEEASATPVVGAKHSAWDGYIWGRNVELIPNKRIVQTWRSTGFQEDDEDSILEIDLEASGEETILRMIHSKVPNQEADVEKGWVDHYFEPMREYFSRKKVK